MRILVVYVCLPNLCAMGRMQHKVNFKQNTAGLNLEFTISETSCHNTIK